MISNGVNSEGQRRRVNEERERESDWQRTKGRKKMSEKKINK